MNPRTRTAVWLIIFTLVLAWSAVAPRDRLTWWLEVSPALIVLAVMVVTRRRFPLTPLLYWLVLGHCVILMVGGHYTYAEVPLGEWLRDLVGGERNNYDKLGHLAQGFVPAMAAREVLLRLEVISRRGWLAVVVIAICLAVSALYELIEWVAALVSGAAAEAFLGTQGYAWDTQSDMAWALAGAVLALLLLTRPHDRQLRPWLANQA